MRNHRHPPNRRPNPKTTTLGLMLALAAGTAALSAQVSTNLRPCSNPYTPQQQIEIGRKAEAQVYQQQPILPDSSPVTQYVQQLGQKLSAFAPGYRWPFNFHVVNVADINAFALPGGAIFVNLGTIQAADDEAQLAAVMAHEISHVVLQHSVCNLEKQKRVGLLAGIGQLVAGVALGGGALGQLAQQSIGAGAGLGFLKMSRGDEKQADLEGTAILYNAGYDPRAMAQFFETIESKYGQGGAQFLSDHPNPGNRTGYVMDEIRTFPPQTHYLTNSPQFQRIHTLVAGMHAYTGKEVASGIWKKKSPNTSVQSGVNRNSAQLQPEAIDMSPPRSWSTFNGLSFSLKVPSTWQALGNRATAMIAPPGGIRQLANSASGNLIYGVLTDVYTPPQGTPPNRMFPALLQELAGQNPGLQTGAVTSLRVDGHAAQSGQSVIPAANGDPGEHDWIVGVPLGSTLRYFVFVAPQANFDAVRPTFEQILKSIRLQ